MTHRALSILCLTACMTSALWAQVSFDRILAAGNEPQNWLTYWGDYSAVRHRDLHQINTSNVKGLRVEWIYQTGQSGSFEGMPLVVEISVAFSILIASS